MIQAKKGSETAIRTEHEQIHLLVKEAPPRCFQVSLRLTKEDSHTPQPVTLLTFLV